MTNLYVLDEREVWHGPLIAAAKARGYDARRIRRGAEVQGPGIGFIRPHADPVALIRNQRTDYPRMREHLHTVQDCGQVMGYEDKAVQYHWWKEWMPYTQIFHTKGSALDFVEGRQFTPLVSKAREGASSVNVRVLSTLERQRHHIRQVFDHGVLVNCCSGGAKVLQNDYVLLQEFVPHQFTWRVNIIGRQMAVFKRHNYANRPVAETGNTEPVMALDEQVESLLEFAQKFFTEAGTRWCAIDVLWDEARAKWVLLETSLAWPWPSPGMCMEAPFFGPGKPAKWAAIWDVLLDEVEAGAWSSVWGKSYSTGT